MKLIIDIPEDMYQTFRKTQPRMGDAGMDSICQAIGNGTPLDKIRDEIYENYIIDDRCRCGLGLALNIIGKYIGEQE